MIIIADDLTGANDTAIQFVKCGLPALVLTHPDTLHDKELFSSYGVVSINTDSRALTEEDAYKTVRSCIEQLPTWKRQDIHFYKKIDSVLRGNTAIEIDAVMDALDCTFAVVAPSYPENNRIVENGILYAGPQTIDAVSLLAEGMHRTVEAVSLEHVRSGKEGLAAYMVERHEAGVSVLIADAVNDRDLALVKEAVDAVAFPVLLSGSAGFAKQIALHMQLQEGIVPVQSQEDTPQEQAPVLVIAGTRHEGTAQQMLQASLQCGVPIIQVPVQDIARGCHVKVKNFVLDNVKTRLAHGDAVLLVAVDSLFAEKPFVLREENQDIRLAHDIARNLASITASILSCGRFSVLITTGGDTSMKVCGELEAIGIEPQEEVYPGIPLGTLVGGQAPGQKIITKSGGFGDDSSLIQIFRYLGIAGKGQVL